MAREHSDFGPFHPDAVDDAQRTTPSRMALPVLTVELGCPAIVPVEHHTP